MMIKRIAVLTCSVFILVSCSSLGEPGLFGTGKRVVASEQRISGNPVKQPTTVNPAKTETKSAPVETEVRTLLIKTDANEKSAVLVAGIALKDSATLSAYTVIVGSYTQPGKSVQLIEKLKQKSIAPYFVRNEKGMYRLVAGTFDNKDDADFLMMKLDVDDIDAWILERLVNPK